ncbi:PREDICTED: uncharacterized protein LOC109215042 [Nicotiana attenuata]|uniref:uncharacterized protein LOC109215042 n=1 Tax=Nicotiana attenuata TaxID=49451 RepID=UPI0009053B19|nr:PREDICTED: uncharacterized protein LOC109215042 [Nicotiana attenuata]
MPQANYNQPPKPPQQAKESLTDMMKKLLIDNQQLRTEFRNLERQFGQMANNQNIRLVGALPSDTEKNSQVNALTLRNGRELVEVPKKKNESFGIEEEKVPKPVEVDEKNKIEWLTEFETVALTEECTSVIQHKLPQKLKDPGSFTIPMRIGEIDVDRALCDLGASINLIPLSMFRQLGLGAPRPSTVMLQLADISYVYPEGIIEDVLLQIGKFIFHADFIILDYEADELVPIIFATRDAIIKV